MIVAMGAVRIRIVPSPFWPRLRPRHSKNNVHSAGHPEAAQVDRLESDKVRVEPGMRPDITSFDAEIDILPCKDVGAGKQVRARPPPGRGEHVLEDRGVGVVDEFSRLS